MSIGARIKQWRAHKNLKQEDACALLGIPFSTFQKYEMDNRKPGADALEAFARTRINVNWLLTGEGEMLMQPEPHGDESAVTVEINRSYGGERSKEPSISAEVTRSTDRRAKDVVTLNSQVLCEIIEAIEKNLDERDLELPPDRKALLIQFLYEQKMDQRHNIEETTKNFFKLIEK